MLRYVADHAPTTAREIAEGYGEARGLFYFHPMVWALTDGTTPYTSTYTYDAAGRLIGATVPDNTLTYGFGEIGRAHV